MRGDGTGSTRDVSLTGEEFLAEWIRPSDCGKLRNRTVVIVNGGFDLFHYGHAALLRIARDVAERAARDANDSYPPLVVCLLDSDRKLRDTKSDERCARPIMRFASRMRAVSVAGADYVVEIDSDAEFVEAVTLLRPRWRVMSDEPRERASRVHVPTVRVKRVPGSISTTNIIEMVRQNLRSEERGALRDRS